jgi:hypothetical protein
VSPYITTKHNVDYALAYSVTAYSYITSTYISAALYTGGGVRSGACLAFSSYRHMVMRLYGKPPAFRPCGSKRFSFSFPFAALFMPLPAAARFS